MLVGPPVVGSASHFLSVTDLQESELRSVISRAAEVKKDPRGFSAAMAGKGLAYYSEKASTRTKLSFQAAAYQMGGFYMEMDGCHFSNGKEGARDTAKVVSKYAAFLAARVHSHALLEELALFSEIPVINALSEKEHPCQSLADLQTISEQKPGKPIIAFVGDGNNVCASLALGACMLGLRVRVASPKEFELPPDVVEKCGCYNGTLELFNDPRAAVEGADVVYTDVWVSMGDEAEAEKRLRAFEGFRVSTGLMALADEQAIFMHCLPANKGLEVTKEVIEGPQSIVYQQAENRLHSQKALLLHLSGG